MTERCSLWDRKQMEPCPPSDQKIRKGGVVPALQSLLCSLCVRHLLFALFPGQLPKAGCKQTTSCLSGNLTLRELGSWSSKAELPSVKDQKIRKELKEEWIDTCVILRLLLRFLLTRSITQEDFIHVLSYQPKKHRDPVRMSLLSLLIRYNTPCLKCLTGYILKLSLHICQRWAHTANKHTHFKQHSVACYRVWQMSGSGLHVLRKLNRALVSLQETIWIHQVK